MSATRALAYVRLSVDSTGTSAGVERQREAVAELCARRGWTIAAEYGARDGSANKGARPGFRQLLDAARAGDGDVIVAWSLDRLSRHSRDTADLIDAGLPVTTVVGGDLDATSVDGEAMATVAAAFARMESRRRTERMRARYEQDRAAGIPKSARPLPGLDRDHEFAPMIGAGWRRVLDGESLSQLAREWAAAGLRTSGGREPVQWDVRRWLDKPRYTGRMPDGTPGRPDAPALVDGDTFDAVAALFADRTRAPRPGGKLAYALPVVGRCGRCGGRLRSIRNGHNGRHHAYACADRHDLVRNGEVPDAWLLALTAARLEQPDAAGLLAPTVDVAALTAERDAAAGRLDALAELVADGTLTAAAVRLRAAPLRARVDELAREISAVTAGSPLAGLPGPDAADRLAGLVPRRLADVYRVLYESVTLEPAPRKGYRFTPDNPGVTVEWRT